MFQGLGSEFTAVIRIASIIIRTKKTIIIRLQRQHCLRNHWFEKLSRRRPAYMFRFEIEGKHKLRSRGYPDLAGGSFLVHFVSGAIS